VADAASILATAEITAGQFRLTRRGSLTLVLAYSFARRLRIAGTAQELVPAYVPDAASIGHVTAARRILTDYNGEQPMPRHTRTSSPTSTSERAT
jgi:hypothetical protein